MTVSVQQAIERGTWLQLVHALTTCRESRSVVLYCESRVSLALASGKGSLVTRLQTALAFLGESRTLAAVPSFAPVECRPDLDSRLHHALLRSGTVAVVVARDCLSAGYVSIPRQRLQFELRQLARTRTADRMLRVAAVLDVLDGVPAAKLSLLHAGGDAMK